MHDKIANQALIMISNLLNQDKLHDLASRLQDARHIVITCHVSPDGDALGSSLGLMHVLKRMGKNVHVVTPDNPPRQLQFLPGIKSLVVATRSPEVARSHFERADLVFCLDFNAMKRLDEMACMLESSRAVRILVDHHLGLEIDADIVFSHPESSSTSALVFRMLYQLGWLDKMTLQSAECIYTGMMTDTGNFSYNSNDPDLYEIVAELVRLGVDKDRLYTLVFNTSSESRLRLCSYALYDKMRIIPEINCALIALSLDELKRFNYRKGDTESLVNVPLSIPEVSFSVFMRQDEPEYVKVSTRSKGTFSVSRLCETYFGGGGHRNAAGGEFHGSLDEAVEYFMSHVGDYPAFNEE